MGVNAAGDGTKYTKGHNVKNGQRVVQRAFKSLCSMVFVHYFTVNPQCMDFTS